MGLSYLVENGKSGGCARLSLSSNNGKALIFVEMSHFSMDFFIRDLTTFATNLVMQDATSVRRVDVFLYKAHCIQPPLLRSKTV